MHCTNCGKEIVGSGKFCRWCGEKLEVVNADSGTGSVPYGVDLGQSLAQNQPYTTPVQGKCPQCGAAMEHRGSEMVCTYCGYIMANLDQNINVRQDIKVHQTVENKPQYNLIMSFQWKTVQPVFFKYAIIALANGAIVERGTAAATINKCTMEFSLPAGFYEIRIGRQKRRVYIDVMHTVECAFTIGGIIVRGEVEPPPEAYMQYQQSVAAPNRNSGITEMRRKPVFLVFGIIFASLFVLCLYLTLKVRNAYSYFGQSKVSNEDTVLLWIFGIHSVLFFCLFFLKDIINLFKKIFKR